MDTGQTVSREGRELHGERGGVGGSAERPHKGAVAAKSAGLIWGSFAMRSFARQVGWVKVG